MKLFIHDWIVVPCQTLAGVAQLVGAALFLVAVVFFVGYYARKIWGLMGRPAEPVAQDDGGDICRFIGGPLDGRLMRVTATTDHYYAAKPTKPLYELTRPPAEFPVMGKRLIYNRTGPQEFTVECADGEHDWKFEDQSFDHAFGTEQIHVETCTKCGATRNAERYDGPEDAA